MKNLLWVVYALFAAGAFYAGWHPGILDFSVRLGAVKAAVGITLIAFLLYSIYCSTRESLPATIRKIGKFHWGRQAGIDLYIGVFLTLVLVYLNEGSILPVLVWLIPSILFANLATLIYIFIHFDQIVARFLA